MCRRGKLYPVGKEERKQICERVLSVSKIGIIPASYCWEIKWNDCVTKSITNSMQLITKFNLENLSVNIGQRVVQSPTDT
jgi:hypothetical protein